MSSNLSELEVTTYDVISDLWASNQVEDADLLRKLLIAAKKGNAQAMHHILEMAQPNQLDELRMETITTPNWTHKLEQLRTLWTHTLHAESGNQQ